MQEKPCTEYRTTLVSTGFADAASPSPAPAPAAVTPLMNFLRFTASPSWQCLSGRDRFYRDRLSRFLSDARGAEPPILSRHRQKGGPKICVNDEVIWGIISQFG